MAASPLPTMVTLLIRAAATSATTSSSTATATANPDSEQRSPVYRVVGIILAISSGLFIGVSFVLKKVGLLRANKKYNEEAGEGYGYLKNAWWWSGMTLMIIGEICNFVAYAFVDAILVTPMGSLSVVVTTILSAIFLKERLSFVGKIGCFNCIIGSVVIVVNSPTSSSVATIQEMQSFVVAPGFLSYAGVIIVGCVIIALWAGPRYGKKSMLVYLSVCSLIGGLSVVATQGLGAAIVAQAGGTPQFNQWFLYVLLVFVIATLLTEIIYLNKALNIFNAALVTPTYYVFFTSATIVTSAILFRGFKGSALEIATIVMGFLQICSGVVLLQLSKSAKDVPDAAVFKGDLDQVRTVAEQEEHESEPKADAIRGTSALIRSFSKARMRMEADEAKRVQEDLLEPIREDEEVVWDGLRRRKTVVGDGQMPQERRKTIHPPLGMSHFPSNGEQNETEVEEGADDGLFPNFRQRAQTMFNLKRNSSTALQEEAGKSTASSHMVPLGDIPAHTQRVTSFKDNGDLSERRLERQDEFGFHPNSRHGFPSGVTDIQDQDTAYKSPRSNLLPISHASTGSRSSLSQKGLALTPQAKRQFSFQNVFSKHRNTSGEAERRPISSSSSSYFFGALQKNSAGGATEEESLGLVQGDDRPDKSEAQEFNGREIEGLRPARSVQSRQWSRAQGTVSEEEADGAKSRGGYSGSSGGANLTEYDEDDDYGDEYFGPYASRKSHF